MVALYTVYSVRLPSLDQFSIVDKNKGMYCIETQNKHCFKHFALFSIRKPNFAYVTRRNLFKKIFSSTLQLVHL
jgi:hypothetical protein